MAKKSKKLPEKLMKYLTKAGVNHKILEHRTVYTAMDAAATMRKKLNEITKSLLVKADKDYYLVILSADQNLDFKKLGAFLKKQTKKPIKVIKIPGEKAMIELLKLKNQTVSAFGQLHNLPVVVDKGLTKARQAVFSSGNFNHSIEMAVRDFIKIENALLGSFGIKKKVKLQKSGQSKKAGKKTSQKRVKK